MVPVLVAVTAGNILTDRQHRSTPNPYVTQADRVTAPRPAHGHDSGQCPCWVEECALGETAPGPCGPRHTDDACGDGVLRRRRGSWTFTQGGRPPKLS